MKQVFSPVALEGEQPVLIDPSLWPLLNLTGDPTYLALRRQHYGHSIVDLAADTGKILGYFQRGRSKIGGIPTDFVEPLVGWEAHGWLGCDRWDTTEWQKALAELRALGQWNIFHSLYHSPQETERLNHGARSLGMPVINRNTPLRVVHGFNSWDEYYRALSKTKRDRYKKTMNSQRKNDLRVTFDVSTEQIQDLYQRRVLRMNAADNAKDARYQRFLQAWIEALRAENRLETVGVWHGDKLVAMAVGFWRDRAFLFNYTAYDQEYQTASPGSIAIYKIIETALNKNARIFSFMGNYAYEKLYSSQILMAHRVDLFAPGLKGRFLHGILKFKQDKQAEMIAPRC